MRELTVLNLTSLLQVINSHSQFKASDQEMSAYLDLRQKEASKLKPFALLMEDKNKIKRKHSILHENFILTSLLLSYTY